MADWIREPALSQQLHLADPPELFAPSSTGRSHYVDTCPFCGERRTFNPDRCVVCGYVGGMNGERLPHRSPERLARIDDELAEKRRLNQIRRHAR